MFECCDLPVMVDSQVLILFNSLILCRIQEVIRLHQLINFVRCLVQLLGLLAFRILEPLFICGLFELANGHFELDHVLVSELTGLVSVYELCP